GRGQIDEGAGEGVAPGRGRAQRSGPVGRREDDLAPGQVETRELEGRIAEVEAGRRQAALLAADQAAGRLAARAGRVDVGGQPDAPAAAREENRQGGRRAQDVDRDRYVAVAGVDERFHEGDGDAAGHGGSIEGASGASLELVRSRRST